MFVNCGRFKGLEAWVPIITYGLRLPTFYAKPPLGAGVICSALGKSHHATGQNESSAGLDSTETLDFVMIALVYLLTATTSSR